MDERGVGEISRVGPKGYIHGWVFVGAPGVGAHVFHSHHGHGTVTAHSGTHATVKFDSGAEHSFEAAPGSGTPRLEPRKLGSMAHGQTPQQVSAGQSNAVALMATMKAKQEARVRMSKAGIPVPPTRADMKANGADDEYIKASDLMYEGKYAEASAALAKAITAAEQSRQPQAAKRLAAYKAKLDKALAKPLAKYAPAPKVARHDAFAERTRELLAQAGLADEYGAARRASDLKYGHGSALWTYWTKGAGFAQWSGAVHKWTTLHALLLKAGVPAHSADGLTTNIITAVMPGYMKQAHAKAQRADAKNKPYGNVTYADPKNGKYPLNSEARIRAAWAYVNMPKNAAMYPLNGVTLSQVKARIRAAMKRIGADVADTASSTASRVEAVFSRIWELEDIRIVSRAQGDGTGRLVEAYAAVFNVPAEIHDQHGDYHEENDPGSFNRSVDHASRQSRSPFRCIYNHGLTLHGTASDRGSIPIGTPEEVRAESRGLLTRTLYNQTPLADEVLEAIRTGGITAQSYTGRILRSSPELRRGEKYRAGRDGRLPTVRRLELALREYGPTPFPAFSGAEILGVRMSTPGEYAPGPDTPQEDEALPPDGEPAAGDPLIPAEEVEGHSARHHQHALFVLRSTELREKAGLVW